MIHPTIEVLQQRGELLNIQNRSEGLDDAVVNVATWMSMARKRLTADDWVVLLEIGRPTVPGRYETAAVISTHWSVSGLLNVGNLADRGRQLVA